MVPWRSSLSGPAGKIEFVFNTDISKRNNQISQAKLCLNGGGGEQN